MTLHKQPRFQLAALILLSLLILALRRPDAFTNPQFWAEDFVFLFEAEHFGVHSLLKPQSGYLLVIPRIIAYAGRTLDPSLQPPLYVFASVAATLAVVASIVSPRTKLPMKPWLALAVIVVPHSGEVFFNPTNLQWILALGLFVIVFKEDPATPWQWAFDVGTVLLCGLSGPFVLVATVFLALRLWRRRNLVSAILVGIAAVCTIVQLSIVLQSPPDREFSGPFSLMNLFAAFTYRLPFGLLFGRVAELSVPLQYGKAISVAVGGAVMAGLAVAILRAPKYRSELLWIAGFGLILVAMAAMRKRIDRWAYGDFLNGDRYWFIPKVTFLWIILVTYAAYSVRWVKLVTICAVLMALSLNHTRLRFLPYVDYNWYALCPDIRAGKEVQVSINPGGIHAYRRQVK